MSDRVEERRAEEIQQERKRIDMRTNKEKAAAAEKFKTTIAAKNVAQQKSTADSGKKQGEKQQGEKQSAQLRSQGAFLARQGIAGRSAAERMVTGRGEDEHLNRSLIERKDKDLRAADERREGDMPGQDRLAASDSPVDRGHDDKQQQSQDQGQGQSPSGGQNQSQTSGGQSGGQEPHQRDGELGVSSPGAKKSAGVTGTTGKVVIGKSDKVAAKERVSTQVLQSIVEKIYQGTQHGMQDFMVQLKDDTLGGGQVRVTLKEGKLHVAFTMKDSAAKNLLESQKGVLMRMFERRGLAMATLEVKVRSA